MLAAVFIVIYPVHIAPFNWTLCGHLFDILGLYAQPFLFQCLLEFGINLFLFCDVHFV
jgi:hypothetical protein